MRYTITIRRVQEASRSIRAGSEEDAAAKVQAELDRPYGYLGSWTTIDTDLEITEDAPALQGNLSPAPGGGPLLLSVKEAAAHLGVRTGTIYDLINSGEISHVQIGSRRYVSREQLTAFIEAHSHTGYTPRR